MLWRHLCLVRAWSAAGLLIGMLLGAPLAARADSEPAEPAPKADAAASQTVSILDARKAGDLKVELRGAGQEHVKMSLENTSTKRLKVVLPPGLVASSVAGQPRGGGGGFQSMGLGSLSNRNGAFGEFRGDAGTSQPGFRSVDVKKADSENAVAIPAGQTIELSLTSVCLNYGVRTPNIRDKFELVDVDDYTPDVRVRKALRSLATYGTSHGVAQAAMWRICNDVPFGVMLETQLKTMNVHEIALAGRFVAAVDASGASDLVDPAYLTEGRLFVRVVADRGLASEAERLAGEIDGMRVLGLPVRVVDGSDDHAVAAPALLLNVVLTGSQAGETHGRIVLNQADDSGQWAPLGKTTFTAGSTASVLDGAGLARALDRAVSSAYVSVKTARRASGVTMLRVENRLPFSLSNVTLKAGNSSGAPAVPFTGLGIAPGRAAVVPIQAPSATVDHVEFNGL